MISVWAARITDVLCTSATIEECDRELYQYGFFILLSRVLFFSFSILIGALFRVPGESIMFYIMFSLLRSYAGGIHAKTELSCTLMTGLAMAASIFVIYLMKAIEAFFVPIGMLVIGTTVIIMFSPLDTKEKPLSNEDRERYRQISRILSIGTAVLAMSATAFECFSMLYCAALAISLEGILLVFGRVKHR